MLAENRRRRLGRFALWGPLALAASVGCGNDLSTLTGKITVGGQPPPPEARGRITFQPVGSGPTVMGQVKPDGSYIAQTGASEGIPIGKYRVNVYGTIGVPSMGGGKARLWAPERYMNYDTSGLEYEVVPGANVKDFDLEKK